MYKNIGSCYVKNNELLSSDLFIFDLHSDKIMYEVIRVINNKAVFFEEHMLRLKESFENFEVDLGLLDIIIDNVNLLISKHLGLNKNIKIGIYKHSEGYH